MEKLTAKQVGKNIIVMINGEKKTKVTKDKKEADSIKKKIELYNKNPNEARLNQIVDIFDKVKKEKEKKEAKKKGIKKAIKKEKKGEKKETKKREVKRASVADIISKAESKLLSDDEIKRLENLIKTQKEEKIAEKQEVKVETTRKPYYGG